MQSIYSYHPNEIRISKDTVQEEFSLKNYKLIAYGTKAGVELERIVEEHWLEWVAIVQGAPWLKYWLRSGLYNMPGTTPKGKPVDDPTGAIALTVYTVAIWGLGVYDWNGQKIMRHFVQLQNKRNGSGSVRNRTYGYDAKIYRGCGIEVPTEIGDLHRWLNGLVENSPEIFLQ